MRRLGRPDVLNGSVVYLISSASTYITGEDILVGGGVGQLCQHIYTSAGCQSSLISPRVLFGLVIT